MCPTEDSTDEEVWRYVQMLDRAGEESAGFLIFYLESDDPFLEDLYVASGLQIGLSRLHMTRLAEYLGFEETQEPAAWAEDFDLGATWLRRVRRSDIS